MDPHSVIHTSTLEDVSRNIYLEDHIVQEMADPVSQPRYAYVKAVLLFSGDSDSFTDYYLEIRKLKRLFKSLNFETQSHRIRTGDHPYKIYEIVEDEQRSITQKMHALGASCMLIIHYTENTDKDDGKHYVEPGMPQPSSAFGRPRRLGGSYFDWHKIQRIFDNAIFDLLLILDYSHSVSDAATYTDFSHGDLYGRIELLAGTHNTAVIPRDTANVPKDTAKITTSRHFLFTRIITATMIEMITNFGRIDISKLHALIDQQSPRLCTVPPYARLREGASKRTIMLERQHVLGEQEQQVVNCSEPMASRPSAGGFSSRLSFLSHPEKKSFRNDASSQFPGGGTINTLDDISILKQPPRLRKTFPARSIHTTTADTSHFYPNLRGKSTPSLPQSTVLSEEIPALYSTSMIGPKLVNLIAERLIKDTKAIADFEPISQIPPLEIGNRLEVFARRLHEEPKSSLEREASGGEPLEEDNLRDRTDTTGRSPLAQERRASISPSQRVYTPQLEGYEEWILKSDAYRWLIVKFKLRAQVHCPGPNIKDQIELDIRRAVFRNMLGQHSLPIVHMQIYVTWDLAKYIKSLGVPRSLYMWNRILCLTGSCNDLQAVPVAGYLRQIWPITGERLEGMLLWLLEREPGRGFSCIFPINLYASRIHES
ncbi:hypothetical protein IG631_05728 [Alternaria alternata]|nr:hypothetical protein IG631_05728 [Alternaria alternata]